MKKFKKSIIIMLVLVFLFSIFIVPYASAYNLFGYKMVGGIRNRYFYFTSPTLSSNWKTPFYDAINKWYNTNTYHAFAETTNWSNSQVDFSVVYDLSSYYGVTYFYYTSAGGAIQPTSQDWKYCEVKLNDYVLNNSTSAERAAAAVTVCYELDHTIGLNENNADPYSIMCQVGTRRATSPSTDDQNGTNYLYPNGWY